jgi:hypothetical protein
MVAMGGEIVPDEEIWTLGNGPSGKVSREAKIPATIGDACGYGDYSRPVRDDRIG